MKTKILENKAAVGWIIALCLIAAWINNLAANHKAQEQAVYQSQAQSTPLVQPSPIINTIKFPEGVVGHEVELPAHGWIKVVLPPYRVSFRISPPKGTIIKFWNGETVIDNGPDGPPNWLPNAVDRSIFYMQNLNGGKATVIIARK